MNITRMWLIRHGEPDQAVRGRCYGDLDIGLSETGGAQMREVGGALADVPLAHLWLSPTRRARESAEWISQFQHCPVEVATGLSEIHFGIFEGRSYDDIAAEYPGFYKQWMENPAGVSFPGGETLGRMWERVTACARMLRNRHRGESIAVVTHGGAIRILLAEALNMPPAEIFRIAQRYGAVNLITYFEDTPAVELMNARIGALFDW
jgi:alpha-ribazole phosphatase/probable phosphoglycerate mutase